MKKAIQIPLMALILLQMTGCSVIEGIFKAGFWSGIIIVVIVVALVIWILTKLLGR
ncbi:hypothetical protein [Parapedobacter sp. SGR-10]|uniref:hypothetical protein n=1 Tax=Parapedobacter sp. SGR-10 TaxID=2710879 RepID=UPI0013CFC441|nr:hypothetical protein [Parapedobacter sp. SGR-10]